ncbi:hypothetical protein GCM10027052_10000 [Parafrigoribacterium mesophilum]
MMRAGINTMMLPKCANVAHCLSSSAVSGAAACGGLVSVMAMPFGYADLGRWQPGQVRREATRTGTRMNSPQRVLFARMPHNAPDRTLSR